jgi:nitroimidazol reductase NimA-like FMN-containing flavoprotein (pyridoxamine 5'-phosphate oxidase superfamily)
VPLNYAYRAGKIYFHGALEGQKLEYLKANPRVCFTVGRLFGQVRRHAEGDLCHPDNDSVICLGSARIIEDVSERQEAINLFNHRFDAVAEDIAIAAAA